jgi:DNA-binding transcriptional MerR regulator
MQRMGHDTTPTSDPGTAPRLLRIQEVAADTGLTPRSIRYYEEMGLLAPAARSEGAYRLYDADDLERLRFIAGLRNDAGFSLAEIGQLLEDEQARERNGPRFRSGDPADQRAVLDDALARVDRQLATLRRKRDRLDAMIADAAARRAHLEGHVADLEAGRQPSHGPHVGAPKRGARG